jgi:hypothetical protein
LHWLGPAQAVALKPVCAALQTLSIAPEQRASPVKHAAQVGPVL